MAKNLVLFVALCLTLCIGSAHCQPVLREQVASVYNSQLGVREATGKNDGPEVEKYLRSVKLGIGYAWCGAFVNWVHVQCSVARPSGAAMALAWFTSKRTIWRQNGKKDRHPQQADLFGLYYPSLKRIGHVGFIDQWNTATGYAITVEGNTNEAGSREGHGVYRKRRLIRQIYVVSDWISN